jgi:hypothetical protein
LCALTRTFVLAGVGKQEQNFGAATRPLSRSDGTGGGDGGGGGAADKGASGKWWGRARITISDEYRNQILFDSSETLSSIVEISHSRCARLLKMASLLARAHKKDHADG